jgi:hypothetical protein
MIRVTISDSGYKREGMRTYSWHSVGHSGQDGGMLCNSVSIIGYTLAGFIENLGVLHPWAKALTTFTVTINDAPGDFVIECKVRSVADYQLLDRINTAYLMALIGILQVHNSLKSGTELIVEREGEFMKMDYGSKQANCAALREFVSDSPTTV